ncbi:MAG: hypothetical protein PVG23_07810 [Nitrosopumilaceae archaeon]|jgi:hypothetical protein
MKQKQKASSILMFAGLFAVLLFVQGNAFAATPTFGMLYYEGDTVRTIIPPSETNKGLDDLYIVTNGVQGQLGIASVAPGDRDYHGGHWIVNEVEFSVEPYSLTSEADVLAAEMAGDVTVTRNVGSFLCPIQPN